jgi:tetratricopeptide (TPR) repeat protein
MNQKELRNNRIRFLETLQKQTPDDPFPVYGLAMEYLGMDDLEQARSSFQHLVESFPDYVPTYYQYAILSLKLQNPGLALEWVEKGIETAKAASDMHALRELMALQEDLDD